MLSDNEYISRITGTEKQDILKAFCEYVIKYYFYSLNNGFKYIKGEKLKEYAKRIFYRHLAQSTIDSKIDKLNRDTLIYKIPRELIRYNIYSRCNCKNKHYKYNEYFNNDINYKFDLFSKYNNEYAEIIKTYIELEDRPNEKKYNKLQQQFNNILNLDKNTKYHILIIIDTYKNNICILKIGIDEKQQPFINSCNDYVKNNYTLNNDCNIYGYGKEYNKYITKKEKFNNDLNKIFHILNFAKSPIFEIRTI
jgi:hypothetical protein